MKAARRATGRPRNVHGTWSVHREVYDDLWSRSAVEEARKKELRTAGFVVVSSTWYGYSDTHMAHLEIEAIRP